VTRPELQQVAEIKRKDSLRRPQLNLSAASSHFEHDFAKTEEHDIHRFEELVPQPKEHQLSGLAGPRGLAMDLPPSPLTQSNLEHVVAGSSPLAAYQLQPAQVAKASAPLYPAGADVVQPSCP